MKYISEILILLLFYLHPGCYSTTIITDKPDFQKILQKKDPVYITTNTGTEIFYKTNVYDFDTDTLVGEGQKVIGLEMLQEPKPEEIPLNDIMRVKVKKLDMGKTIVSGIFLTGILYWHYMWSQTETQ